MAMVSYEPRTTGTLMEPFSLMRNLLRLDPREFGLPESKTFTSAFDVFETPEGYQFRADLPGIKKEDLDINLSGNRLTISGKRESVTNTEQEKIFIQERYNGSFCRTFNLPEGIDASGVRAEMKDGVLSLLIPKLPEVQPRKIEVKVS